METDILHLGLLEDEGIALDTAALEIAALDHPGVLLSGYVELLDDLTERLATTSGFADTATERAQALARVIAGEFGFTGDRESYDHADNADLIRVIDRRRGLPVSLAILYVSQARRLGWEADALNTPGHVLVRIGSATHPVLLDAFDDGAVIGAETLSALLARILGPGVSPSAEHLAPMSNRSVLTRLLMNQSSRAEAAGETERALTLYRRITAIAPANGNAWWARARLELGMGEPTEARASLSAMLEVTRDRDMRAHIFAALDALSGSTP